MSGHRKLAVKSRDLRVFGFSPNLADTENPERRHHLGELAEIPVAKPMSSDTVDYVWKSRSRGSYVLDATATTCRRAAEDTDSGQLRRHPGAAPDRSAVPRLRRDHGQRERYPARGHRCREFD